MPPRPPRAPVVALLGDIVKSKRLPPDERADVQLRLERLLARINERYASTVLGQFLITIGDEFQGILDQPGDVPDIVQDIREEFPTLDFRIAVSFGEITTGIKTMALGTDGPAWYAARALIEEWRRAKRHGVAFTGFKADDSILNGLSGLLTYHWSHLEASQREIITALRHHEGLRKEAAAEMKISQQALSNRAQTAGWREYDAGMQAWRDVLRRTSWKSPGPQATAPS